MSVECADEANVVQCMGSSAKFAIFQRRFEFTPYVIAAAQAIAESVKKLLYNR